MKDPQLDELITEIALIQTNTSWTWYNNNELEKLNEKVAIMLSALDENNELLRELICALQNQRG